MSTPCSQCAAPVFCGVAEPSCWCQTLPSLPASALAANNTCLCPACLKAALKQCTLVFGIANCDTVKKTRTQLATNGTEHVFWDFKKFGVPADWLDEWIAALGFEALLNKRGTTWRKLPPDVQSCALDAAAAKALMLANPSIIKRPVIQTADYIQIGL